MERPAATFQVSGTALRRTRMRQGLGIKQTAETAGITRSYLQRLETGSRTRMRPETYAALRTALGLTPDDDAQLLAPPEKPE